MATNARTKAMAHSKQDEGRRPARVAARIRDELAGVLVRDLSDPRLANVVISDVRVTDDLSTAFVSIVVMGDDEAYTRAEEARRVLVQLEGGLRKRLGPALNTRRIPSLKFQVDRGREASARLDALLHEVSEELRKKPAE